jgi:hypothetical protein
MSLALEQLASLIRAQGGLLAAAAADPDGAAAAPEPHGAVAAGGPRAAEDRAEYALLVEAIREGYLLHYVGGRVLRPEDPDLALLAGDQLYALGLARLAALGDLEAVVELADVISLAAQAQAAGDAALAEAVWEAGAAAVGHGPPPELAAAKAAARAEDAAAAGRLRAAARQAEADLASGH